MQVRRGFFFACFATLGLGVACSDTADPIAGSPDDDPDASTTTNNGSSGSSGTGPGRDGGESSSSGGSSGSSSGTVVGPVRPTACALMTTGTFANGPGLTPRQYGAQPTFRGVVVTPEGEEVLDDLLNIRIDSATGPGTYELGASGVENCYENGAQCVYLHEDVFSGSSNRFYAAVRGRLRIDAQITTDQSAGVLEYVELREARIEARNVPFNAATLEPEGRCIWIENAAFDTRRPGGCNPRTANPCPAGEACIRENTAGTDGTCRASTGGGTNGATCVQDTTGGSPCGVEYMCSEDPPGARKCRRLCDLFADDNACPTNTICGPFGYCEPPKNTQVDETVLVGETCNVNRFYCGPDGARGACFNARDASSQPLPEGPRCHAFQHSRAACGDQELAYLGFDGYDDRSLATCVPRQ